MMIMYPSHKMLPAHEDKEIGVKLEWRAGCNYCFIDFSKTRQNLKNSLDIFNFTLQPFTALSEKNGLSELQCIYK